MVKLLLVEDQKDFADTVVDWLAAEGYMVDLAATGPDALGLLRTREYDLIILDLNLPGLNGLDVSRTFRRHGGTTPILMLTGNRSIDDKELGFEAGADDYLTKPFHMRELSLRVRARLGGATKGILKVRDLVLIVDEHRVTRDGKSIDLLPREFALLEFFMKHPGKVFSAEALVQRVWSSTSDASPDTIRSHITRLRSKLGYDSDNSLIVTVHGVGYKLEP